MHVLQLDAMTAARHAATNALFPLLMQAVRLLQTLLYASFAAALVCFMQPCTIMLRDIFIIYLN